MSLRTVVRGVARTQCIRRAIHISNRQLQEPSTDSTSLKNETDLKEPVSTVEALLSRALAKNVPSKPSALESLSSEDLSDPFLTILKPAKRPKVKPPVVGTPVPKGYDSKIYGEVKRLAEEGKKPTRKQLDNLLRLMEFDSPEGELRHEAREIWREMRSRGVRPTQIGYKALLQIAGTAGDTLMQDEIVQTLPQDGITLSAPLIHCLLVGFLHNHEIERAIFLFRDIRARGILARIQTYRYMITQCVEAYEAEEAFQILIDLKNVYGAGAVTERHWWQVLACSARNGFLEGTLYCWRYIQDIPGVQIPEGYCLQVLSVAARHGKPALATSVFNAMSNLNISYSGQHFLPLVEAYTRCGDIRQAFIVLSIMRESSLSPPQLSQLNFLTEEIAKSTETLDKAYFTLQDLVKIEVKTADITAFNVLLKAAILRNDASRVISTYADAASFKVQPNLETFNLILHGVSLVGHFEMAMFILSDLKAAQITPDRDTYSRVILTCLHRPDNTYEDAFVYLEEMKAAGWVPAAGIYASFVKKCVFHNDGRAMLLLDEMKKVGHRTDSLISAIEARKRLGAHSKLFDRRGSRYARQQEAVKEEMGATERNISRQINRSDGDRNDRRNRYDSPAQERDRQLLARMDQSDLQDLPREVHNRDNNL